jgi:NAD(P)-dependent dehydrogenase (short-subunit alcohol dehydrogenase family)
MPDLDGKVAVVTGAGRGIGRAEAVELSVRGASVIVNDVDGDQAGEVAELIRRAGRPAIAHQSDISTWTGARSLVERAEAEFGALDVLVNNAGVLRDAMSFNLAEHAVDAVLAVNIKGTLALASMAAAYWRDRAKTRGITFGRLINTTSESGLFPNPGQTLYAASKAAVAAATICMARELSRYGVTVNAIAPRARTRLTEAVLPAEVDAALFDPEWVAAVVAWLASDSASDVNGQVLVAWGGPTWRLDGWRVSAEAAPPDGGWTAETVGAARTRLFPDGAAIGPVVLPGNEVRPRAGVNADMEQ